MVYTHTHVDIALHNHTCVHTEGELKGTHAAVPQCTQAHGYTVDVPTHQHTVQHTVPHTYTGTHTGVLMQTVCL